MKRALIIAVVAGALACAPRKPPSPKAPAPKKGEIEKILDTARQYKLKEKVPDLWNGILIYSRLAKEACNRGAPECQEAKKTLKNAVLSGIKIATLLDEVHH